MSWKTRARPVRRIHVRLTLIVTLAAAISSIVVYGILLGSLFMGFGDQDRAELDSRLLSYWAAWQYGGNEAVLDRASIDMKEHGGRPFLLMLDLLHGPQNIGSLLRTAEICGAHGVIVQDRRAPDITPAVVQYSAGAAEHLLIAQVTNLAQTIVQLQQLCHC